MSTILASSPICRLTAAVLLAPLLMAADPGDLSLLPPTPPHQSNTVGVQTLLTIHCDWPDVTGDEASPDASGLPYEQASERYFRAQSFGRTAIVSAPLAHVRMTMRSDQGGEMGYGARMSEAIRVLKADTGIDAETFHRVRLMNPGPIGSSGKASGKYVWGTHPEHELAHTYGMGHVSGLDIGVHLFSGAKIHLGWLIPDDPDGYGYHDHVAGTAEYDLVSERSMEHVPGTYRALRLPTTAVDDNGWTHIIEQDYSLSMLDRGLAFYRGGRSASDWGIGNHTAAVINTTQGGTVAQAVSVEAEDNVTGDIVLGTQVDDALYIGKRSRFNTLAWRVSTPPAGEAGVFEYWNGTAWLPVFLRSGPAHPASLAGAMDAAYSHGLTFFAMPGDWTLKKFQPSDDWPQYWVRYRNTASRPAAGRLDWIRAYANTNQGLSHYNHGIVDVRHDLALQPPPSGFSQEFCLPVGASTTIHQAEVTHVVTVLSETLATATTGGRMRVRVVTTPRDPGLACRITAPVAGARLPRSTPFTLQAAVSDPAVIHHVFYGVDTGSEYLAVLGTGYGPTFSYTSPYGWPAGLLTVRAVATDDYGGKAHDRVQLEFYDPDRLVLTDRDPASDLLRSDAPVGTPVGITACGIGPEVLPMTYDLL